MICPICELEISPEEKFMFPIERPYLNMWVHKVCNKEKDINNIILQNPQIVYNYLEKYSKIKK